LKRERRTTPEVSSFLLPEVLRETLIVKTERERERERERGEKKKRERTRPCSIRGRLDGRYRIAS